MGNAQIWIGRVTGFFGLLGSTFIIYMILSDREKKLGRPYHRLMLMMSIFHILQTMAVVINVAAVPIESNIDGAKGNKSTCMAQGFFIILGLAIPLYNASLNIYYSLTILHSVSSEQFSRIELMLHTVSILFPFSAAITFTACGFMAPIMDGACSARGKLALYTYQSVFGISFLITIISMACICWKVITTSTRVEKYTKVGRRKNSSTKTAIDRNRNQTVEQAFLYISAYILTYAFPFTAAILTKGKAGKVPPYAIIILTSIFYPLQGFWNFCFYIRPGVCLVMRSGPNISYFNAIKTVVLHPGSTTTTIDREQAGGTNLPVLLPNEIMEASAASQNKSSLTELDNPNSNKIRSSVLNNDLESCDKPQLDGLILAQSIEDGASSTPYPSVEQNIDKIHDSKQLDSETLKDVPPQIMMQQKVPHDSSIPLSNSKNQGKIKIIFDPDVVAEIPQVSRCSNKTTPSIGHEEINANDTFILCSECDENEDDPEEQSEIQLQSETNLRRRSLIEIGSVLNAHDSNDSNDY